jgi:hypothetical protein
MRTGTTAHFAGQDDLVSDNGDAAGRMSDEAFDRQRPRFVRLTIGLAALAVATLFWVTRDLSQKYATPLWALIALAAAFGATFLGAFLIGRKRMRRIRSGQVEPYTGPSPSWLGPMLAIIPGFAIVGSQVIRGASPLGGTLLGLVVAYFLTMFVGAAVGVLIPI